MSSGFEESFAKVLRAGQIKQSGEKPETRGRKPRPLQLGDTQSGKALFKPKEPIREDAVGGSTIHEIPAHRGHATKRHGKRPRR